MLRDNGWNHDDARPGRRPYVPDTHAEQARNLRYLEDSHNAHARRIAEALRPVLQPLPHDLAPDQRVTRCAHGVNLDAAACGRCEGR